MVDIASTTTFRWIRPDTAGDLKICIIGAGKMARIHMESLKDMQGVSVQGISSQRGTSGEKLAAEFGIPKAYTDWRLMLEEIKPDALFVAVSHSVAFQLYKDVLAYGIPCMLEKPAGYSVAETKELAHIASAHRTFTMVGVNRRFYGNLQQALVEMLHQGPIYGITVECNEPIFNYRNRLQFESWVYDDWMMANSIHAIDLFRMIGGEVKDIKTLNHASFNNYTALIEFENGTTGTFIAYFNSSGGFGVKLYGEGVSCNLIPMDTGIMEFATGRLIRLKGDAIDAQYKAGIFAQNALFVSSVMKQKPLAFPGSDIHDHLKTIELIEKLRAGVVAVQEPQQTEYI